jgi:protein tyrosine phosphatase
MVRLMSSGGGAETTTYINANLVANPYNGSPDMFIATQAPLPTTINNFWHMIFQKKSTCIVMLCGLLEHGRVSCDVYWPDPQNGTPEIFKAGGLEVSLKSIQKLNEFFWVREINIKVV